MKSHFGLTKKNYKSLLKKGVTVADFMKAIPMFDVLGSGEKISPLCLYLFIDTQGSFEKRPATKPKLIARALFSQLPDAEKMQVYQYIEYIKKLNKKMKFKYPKNLRRMYA